MIEVRFATPADAALIADLSREAFQQAFAADNTPANMEKFMTETFTREKLMAEVAETANLFLLAYAGNEVAGYARLREAPNPPELGDTSSLEIARIYAAPGNTGKGAGSALMQRCIEVAKEKGSKIIWLGVWEHNQRAIAFYTRWGFQRFGEHIFEVGDDPQTDWLMKKEL